MHTNWRNIETFPELEEAFFLFDYDKDKMITTKEVGVVVRSVGLNPTELELKEMMNDVNSSESSEIPSIFSCVMNESAIGIQKF